MKQHATPSQSSAQESTSKQSKGKDFGDNSQRKERLLSVSQKEQEPSLRMGMQKSATQNPFSVRLQGASISPPDFPNGLVGLHDWLMSNQQSLANWSGNIEVEVKGKLQQREQLIWSYYHPNQKLILKGVGGATISGFSQQNGKKEATPGYFLAYRPIIPQQMTTPDGKPQPAAANIKMIGLTIEGFVSGGVEVSPRSGSMPSAEQWNSGTLDPEQGHDHAGIHAFLSGAVFKNNTFQHMGTKHLAKGKERYNPTDPEAYKYAGYGGIIARGLNYSQFIGNEFTDLVNRKSSTTNESNGNKVNWDGLVHGLYLRDNSSRNSILKNDFSDISGAAVKFTNQAHYNKVRKNKSQNTGKNAFVLEHFNPNREDGLKEKDSKGYGKKIGTASDNKKYIAQNKIGNSYNTNDKQDLFTQKRVGK